jgi:hypothetical protein
MFTQSLQHVSRHRFYQTVHCHVKIQIFLRLGFQPTYLQTRETLLYRRNVTTKSRLIIIDPQSFELTAIPGSLFAMLIATDCAQPLVERPVVLCSRKGKAVLRIIKSHRVAEAGFRTASIHLHNMLVLDNTAPKTCPSGCRNHCAIRLFESGQTMATRLRVSFTKGKERVVGYS